MLLVWGVWDTWCCGECTNGRDGGDDLAQLQLVQDGRLSGRVQADHQDTHLLLAPEAIEQLRECETHLGGCRVGVVELWREMQGDQQMVPGLLLAKRSHSTATPLAAALIYAPPPNASALPASERRTPVLSADPALTSGIDGILEATCPAG